MFDLRGYLADGSGPAVGRMRHQSSRGAHWLIAQRLRLYWRRGVTHVAGEGGD